jgi:hypothetical protein
MLTILWVAALTLIAAAALPAQEGMTTPDMPDMETMMKIWEAARTPGKMHKLLEPLVGSWETTSRIWMQGPGAPPTESKGTAETEWILGGRYVRMDSHGQMMGQPMRGIGWTGYDNFKKKFTMLWMDDMSTAMYFAKGDFDPEGKVLTVYGEMDEPMTGEIGKPVKYVTRIIDENTHVFEIHDLVFPEGKTMVVEVTYTRK